jgi:hypothetical protein
MPRTRKLLVSRQGKPAVAIDAVLQTLSAEEVRQSRLPAAARLRQLDLASALAAHEAKRRFVAGDDALVPVLAASLSAIPQLLELIFSDNQELAAVGADPLYTGTTALSLARATAIGTHLVLQTAYSEGLAAGSSRSSAALARRLDAEEISYRRSLRFARDATIEGDAAMSLGLVSKLSAATQRSLAAVCLRAGGVSTGHSPRARELALRAAALARRHTMLTAATLLLQWRIGNPRTAASARKTASDRRSLTRPARTFAVARTTLNGYRRGRHAILSGRVEGVGWRDRPRKPISSARLVSTDTRLVVPHKNMHRYGVVSGAYVWARGRVNSERDRRFLEIRFEPLTEHARRYWEDWLAVLARPAYDLYPGSLQMEWEFPPLLGAGASTDLIARMVYAQ